MERRLKEGVQAPLIWIISQDTGWTLETVREMEIDDALFAFEKILEKMSK
jgi:hypothetical protein